MRKTKILISVTILATVILSSCGINKQEVSQNETGVKNFPVQETVQSQASSTVVNVDMVAES
jgi:hypothetical protein